MGAMLQTLVSTASSSPALVPLAVGEIADALAAQQPLTWIDAVDPDRDELTAIAAAVGWPAHVLDTIDEREERQRALKLGGWLMIGVRSPVGDGMGLIAVDGSKVVTLRFGWPVDLADSAGEVVGWPEADKAQGMAVVCVLLNRLVEVYEDAAGDLEDRLVLQEGEVLNASKGGNPLPALQETAKLRGAVGDLRRRVNRLREVIGTVIRQELIDRGHGDAVDLELRDIYDHLLRVHDDLDAYGERLIALQDSRLSLVAYKQNDITKKISGWGAVLLIPTVTTGWYGQNFSHLWLLDSPAGPFVNGGISLLAMAAAIVLLRRADWI